jgi:stage II sporulation protein AA (anti-sigma F factor antagonist)
MLDQFWIRDGKQEGTAAFIAVGGRLGASAAHRMLGRLESLLDAGYIHVVINMADVTFIASSGAGTLVVISEEFRTKDGSVQIVSASASVRRVIDLLNLERFVSFAKDEKAALANIQALRNS